MDVRAARGQEVLRQLVATDPGAARLGELALVPHSSPVSQTGHLFFSTLFDENAASHLAIGSAYAFTLEGGEAMTRRGVRARRRQPERHARRLHDRVGRTGHRRRARRWHDRARDAGGGVGGLTSPTPGAGCLGRWFESLLGSANLPGSIPGTWVTVHSGDMGNTFGPKGFSIGSSRHVSSSK